MTGIKQTEHTAVLLQEAVEALAVKSEHWYVDGTFGFGSHSRAILDKGANVLGIEQDATSLELAQKAFVKELNLGSLVLHQGNFRSLSEIISQNKIKPSGFLFDLGFSSWQLDKSGRGFSFLRDEMLDMRMDPQHQGVTARDLLAGLYEPELAKLIGSYGEDPLARHIARQIVVHRSKQPIVSTFELANLVRNVYRHYYRNKSTSDPATKTFQALRIAVNDEMNALREALKDAVTLLEKEGVIAVITFHGLEDRTVKHIFTDWEKEGIVRIENKKPVLPSLAELTCNPRSHSAKLRSIIKI